ncbi:MAG: DNA polymerase III subunit delta [Coriobacteriia bacterium]|nr:DNA polymerase III subunit delta [Coriobacteriia bacterium]
MAVSSVDELKPVYLIHGKDGYLLDAAVRRLKAMFEAVDPAGMDIDVFDAKECAVEEVVAAANTLPFVSPRRLVVVKNLDAIPASEHPPLVAYVEAPAAHTCLVLVSTRLARNTRLYKALESGGAVAEYTAPRRAEMASWIAKLVASKGKSIEREACDELIAATGGDLRLLDAEVDKLVAYLGEREVVRAEDVSRLVTPSTPPVWTFYDAVAARDAGAALGVLQRLVAEGEEPHVLLAGCVRRIRQVMAARSLSDRGEPVHSIQRELAVADWQAKRLARDAARFRQDELVSALRLAADAEANMKTSQGVAGLVLERWVLDVCGTGGRTSDRRA